MDPSFTSVSDSEDEEAVAMAAAMGFTSFGAKKPANKKRKFNTATDAFVEGDELETVDRGGKKGQGSGGNEIPLGKMRMLGVKSKENEDEIDLDDGEDDSAEKIEDLRHNGQSQTSSSSKVRKHSSRERSEEADDDEEGPRYMDTSQPAPIDRVNHADASPPRLVSAGKLPPNVGEAEAAEMQRRIDAILASIQPPPGTDALPFLNHSSPPLPELSSPAQLRSVGMSSRSPVTSLPSRLPVAHDTTPGIDSGGNSRRMSNSTSVASGRTSTVGTGRGGARNPEWYLGYYDPSFNQNPWAKLEKDLGLESAGTWIDRPSR